MVLMMIADALRHTQMLLSIVVADALVPVHQGISIHTHYWSQLRHTIF